MSKRPKKSVWHISNGWSRTITKSGSYYFHDGKRVSQKRFANIYHRQTGKHLRLLEEEAEKKYPNYGNKFCLAKNRADFYERVLEDRKQFRDKLGEEASSSFQLWFQIGSGEKRRKKKDKRLQYTHGLRKFTHLKKAKIFLGLSPGDYDNPSRLPKWSKSGRDAVCEFEKTAWLVLPRSRGKRALSPRILKKYILQE